MNALLNVLPGVVLLGILVAILVRAFFVRRGHRELWQRTAALLNARFDKRWSSAKDEIHGSTNGLQFIFGCEEDRSPSDRRASLRFFDDELPSSPLRIVRRSALRHLMSETVPTGDEGFDHTYDVLGDEVLIAAVLDPHTRRMLTVSPAEIRVQKRAFQANFEIAKTPAEMASQIENFGRLAGRFRLTPEALSSRLFDALKIETSPAGRHRIYRALIQRAEGELRLQVLHHGLDHSDRKLRCLALENLGENLRERALEMFHSTTQHASVRAAAASALGLSEQGHLSLIAVDENQGAVSLANGPGALSVTSSDDANEA